MTGASAPHRRGEDSDEQLASYRASIDNIDAALVHLLAERFKITKAVGRHKALVGLPASDPAREDQQIARLRALASESGLDPAFTESFLRFIVSEVIRHHQQTFEGEGQSPSPSDPLGGSTTEGSGEASGSVHRDPN